MAFDVLQKAVCSQISDVYELLTAPPNSDFFSHGFISINVQMVQYFTKKQSLEEKVQKLKTDLCIRTLFFLLSSPINHLTTPQIYLMTLWRARPLGWEPLD